MKKINDEILAINKIDEKQIEKMFADKDLMYIQQKSSEKKNTKNKKEISNMLLEGIYGNNIEIITEALKHGANPNTRINKHYPMIVAIEKKYYDALELMVKYGGDLNFTVNENPIWFSAICDNDLKFFKKIENLGIAYNENEKNFEKYKFIEKNIKWDTSPAIFSYFLNKKEMSLDIDPEKVRQYNHYYMLDRLLLSSKNKEQCEILNKLIKLKWFEIYSDTSRINSKLMRHILAEDDLPYFYLYLKHFEIPNSIKYEKSFGRWLSKPQQKKYEYYYAYSDFCFDSTKNTIQKENIIQNEKDFLHLSFLSAVVEAGSENIFNSCIKIDKIKNDFELDLKNPEKVFTIISKKNIYGKLFAMINDKVNLKNLRDEYGNNFLHYLIFKDNNLLFYENKLSFTQERVALLIKKGFFELFYAENNHKIRPIDLMHEDIKVKIENLYKQKYEKKELNNIVDKKVKVKKLIKQNQKRFNFI